MMKFSFGKHTAVIVLTTTISFIAVVCFFTACDDSTPPPVVPPDDPPTIDLFTMDSTSFHAGYTVTFGIRAVDDKGLDSAIINYGDGNRFRFDLGGAKHFAPFFQRTYGTPGFYTTSLVVYDSKHQIDQRGINVMVFPPDTLATPVQHYRKF
jgi:hypothetical protein